MMQKKMSDDLLEKEIMDSFALLDKVPQPPTCPSTSPVEPP